LKSITKSVDEELILEFEFARELEHKWRSGRQYALNTYVRPTVLNGLEYKVTTAGQSAEREPKWPTTVGETVQDGSVVWTAQTFADNASDSISSQTVTTDAGLTISGIAQTGTRVSAKVAAGTGRHVVVCQVTTASGEVLELEVAVVIS
jgi:hypothetical protein